VYLADIKEFATLNEIYLEFFSEPFPARTTISCVLRDILIEVDAIAEV
jgi:2-iminobutanoate/2-iminopropanoate deaminase